MISFIQQEKLKQKILDLNEEAIRQIKLEKPKEALVLLQNGEKILDVLIYLFLT
jgi:hypothetical protein